MQPALKQPQATQGNAPPGPIFQSSVTPSARDTILIQNRTTRFGKAVGRDLSNDGTGTLVGANGVTEL